MDEEYEKNLNNDNEETKLVKERKTRDANSSQRKSEFESQA